MESFMLQIVTPDGLLYDDWAKSVRLRTIEGDVGIRARHVDFLTALGMGNCKIQVDDEISRQAACMGGMVTMLSGKVRIVATTFEWFEEMDVERVLLAKKNAEDLLAASPSFEEEQRAKAHLERALVRLGVIESSTKIK